ncbi:NaeI family type II restriction endonuclease [Pseudomonas viridiflava]|uniref:NaeI family type II restriction endonuclease n=1 Tax=Pseudomonas viridiflava TaxID=33069 RepID=UPI000F03D6C8|nr:NaeI family type II restriction endonuclease [Pseudomonas viridiflava]
MYSVDPRSLHSKLLNDPALAEVYWFLAAKTGLVPTIGKAIRKAFDEVIDGPRTGRFQIEQLEKTEKTYIGTKVEIVLRAELELERGRVLDNLICGHEVDTKFSIRAEWMIPREAVGQICLLVAGDDNLGTFVTGLLRMTEDVLTVGSNQDGKRSISAKGRKEIVWLALNESMPKNFLLHLPTGIREKIMRQQSGKQRVKALFQNVTHQIIPRTAIEQVAQQKDPMKRAREMKEELALEGFQVLCSTYDIDREFFRRHGFHNFTKGDWLSIRRF